ncbi:MAG: class I SAM-dependent methyltransferase [Thiohalospira sp.]
MENGDVEQHFARQAGEYDALMARIIPWYGPGQELMVDLLPLDPHRPIRVLDLGSGPCSLAAAVLARWPQATIHAVDLTEEMLADCRSRLAAFGARWSLQQGDFREVDLGAGYDAILAGLTLHHLTAEERRTMYRRLRTALNPGGILVARDVLRDTDPAVTAWHHRLWRDFMQAQGEDGDFWLGKHREKDHAEPLEVLMRWEQEAGFERPVSHWRQHHFAIHTASVPDPE